jgi:hypothetical protein
MRQYLLNFQKRTAHQRPREAKSSPYARPSYETALAAKGSFWASPTCASQMQARNCVELYWRPNSQSLNTSYSVTICSKKPAIVCERETKLWFVRDISPLICPSARVLRIYGAKNLKPLNESVNEGWNSATVYLITVLSHSLITPLGLDGLLLRTINSKSLYLSLTRLQTLLPPISWLLGRCTSRF